MKKTKQNAALGTHFFNARLFLEAVKRLRVIGIALAILALTLSVLIPSIQWISDKADYERRLANYYEMLYEQQNSVEPETKYNELQDGTKPLAVEPDIYYDDYYSDEYDPDTLVKPEIEATEVNYYLLCLPLLGIPFFAPFFCLVLFSFLHKRKQSDFYHAIPYTRTCVYVSFVTAALAFVFVIQIASALTSGLIYAASPFSTFAFGDLALLTVNSMLAGAFLASFMMLSLSVTGTGATTMLLFALFASLTRIVLFLFSYVVDQFLVVTSDSFPFFSPLWYLPIRIFASTGSNLPGYAALIPYTAIVTLLLFVVAGILYKYRRSEMAERSAPNKLMQSIFRCLFTLPFAILLTALILAEEVEFEGFLILLTITLLVFYLYELITTKRPKNMLKATPWLGVVAGGMVTFVLVFTIFGAVVHREIPEDKIVSVKVEVDASDTFESIMTADIATKDERMISLVSTALENTLRYEKYGFPQNLGRRYVHDVSIRQTNGTTARRHLYLTEEEELSLKNLLVDSEEYREHYLRIPEAEDITRLNIYPEGSHFYFYTNLRTASEIRALWEIFTEEYSALSPEEQRNIKDLNSADWTDDKPVYDKESVQGYSPFFLCLNVSGTYGSVDFYSTYLISPAMPRTMEAVLSGMVTNQHQRYYNKLMLNEYGNPVEYSEKTHTASEIGAMALKDLVDGKVFSEGELNLAYYGDYSRRILPSVNHDYTDFYTLLLEYTEDHTEHKEGTFPLVVDAYFYSYDANYEYTVSAEFTYVLYLTEAEYAALIAEVDAAVDQK